MFRWAICQLDILRRLYRRSKIRQAIGDLLETLGETYERIFLPIPTEEPSLVRTAIHLVCFHDFLWEGSTPLPAQVLLEFYTIFKETQNSRRPGDFLLDLDTLEDTVSADA